MTTTRSTAPKTELTHPRTGRKMMIDKKIYDAVSKAIHHELKKNKAMSWSHLASGVSDYLAAKNIRIDGSVEWYAISVRNDMVTKGMIHTFKEKGKMMNTLSN